MRVAVVGAGGQLGSALVARFAGRGDPVLALRHADLDLADHAAGDLLPGPLDVVINAAAWTDVDGCARDPDRAGAINGVGAGNVAAAAARAGALSVQVSTNEVFDGLGSAPYAEADPRSPGNPYGRSKQLGEEATLAANPRALVIRTAWLFGGDRPGFPEKIRAAAERMVAANQPLRVVSDEVGNPTPVPALADRIVRLVDMAVEGHAPLGTYHVAGEPPISRLEWAREILSDMPELVIEPIELREYSRPSVVPPRAVLDMTKVRELGIEPIRWREIAAAAHAPGGVVASR